MKQDSMVVEADVQHSEEKFPVLARIAASNFNLAQELIHRSGLLQDTDLFAMIAIDPTLKVLVNCGNGKFFCEACKVAGICDVINAGRHKDFDYVREISISVPDEMLYESKKRAGSWAATIREIISWVRN